MSNESIVAMAIGVMLGAIIMIIGISVILSQVCRAGFNEARGNGNSSVTCGDRSFYTKEPLENAEEEPASMQKQWENFFNYNGSDKGQTPIGGDE